MIIYNITTKVSTGIDAAWVKWQREQHIPEMMRTGLFIDYTFSQLLEQDDSEGKTYVVQCRISNMDNYESYINRFAAKMRESAFEAWGNQFISFRSILEVIH